MHGMVWFGTVVLDSRNVVCPALATADETLWSTLIMCGVFVPRSVWLLDIHVYNVLSTLFCNDLCIFALVV